MNAEHDKRCEQEGTRDAVFLFQWRRYHRTDEFPGTESSGESLVITRRDELPGWALRFADDDGKHIRESPGFIREAIKREAASLSGFPLYYETWETEGVWLSSEEATSYGDRKNYNYPEGWRVYCVPAEGELAKRLREFGE